MPTRITLAAGVLLVCAAGVFVVDTALGGSSPVSVDPGAAARLDALYRQIHETHAGLAGDPGLDRPVHLDGPHDHPELFTGIPVLSHANPLLTEECKKEALYKAIQVHSRLKKRSTEQSLEAVSGHVAERQRIIAKNGISIDGYYRHLTECKGFCGPHATELLSCHVLAVTNSAKEMVLFELDSDQVSSSYDRQVLRQVASELRRDRAKKLVLIGRASPPGPTGYNRALSGHRVEAVKRLLQRHGISSERISTVWLGEEPPQLEDWIANQYRLHELRISIGHDQLNQSVLVVIY